MKQCKMHKNVALFDRTLAAIHLSGD